MTGGHGRRTGDTQRLVDALGDGPRTSEQLAIACALTLALVGRRLRQRANLRGDVELVDGHWRTRPAVLKPRKPRTRKAKPAPLLKGDAAVRERAAREVVCETATPRTYAASGVWSPPAGLIMRPGALDYLATPTRVGDERLPYRGATNMSTTATAAGARSGLK